MSSKNQRDSFGVIKDFGDRQYMVDTLNSFENKFDVASWKYRDIHIWPIVKTICFIKWFYHYNKQAKKAPNRLSTISKLGLIKDTGLELMRLLFLPKKTVSIFSTGGDWQNALTENNKSVNRFLHPIFEEYYDQDHVYAQYSDKETHTSSKVRFLKLLALVRAFRLKNKFSESDFTQAISKNREFQHFTIELSEKSGIAFSKLLPISLVSNLSEFFTYQAVYRKLLSKYNPQVCMFSGYDKIQNYALIYEASRRNIPTVDVQHGLTGKLHLGYSQFLNIPEGGYNILPSTFWCWDEESKKTVDSWARDTNVNSFVGGNPWLSYTSKQQLDTTFPDGKKVILVTLQHNGIPDIILEAIQNNVNQYYWVLRIHPRFAANKQDLVAKLEKQIEANQVLVHNALEIVLPPLLKKVDVHVTQFSSTVLEASYLGIPSVVIDAIGESSYKHLIERDIVLSYLGDDYRILNEKIEKLLNTNVIDEFVDVSIGVRRLKEAMSTHSKMLGNAV